MDKKKKKKDKKKEKGPPGIDKKEERKKKREQEAAAAAAKKSAAAAASADVFGDQPVIQSQNIRYYLPVLIVYPDQPADLPWCCTVLVYGRT